MTFTDGRFELPMLTEDEINALKQKCLKVKVLIDSGVKMLPAVEQVGISKANWYKYRSSVGIVRSLAGGSRARSKSKSQPCYEAIPLIEPETESTPHKFSISGSPKQIAQFIREISK